MPYQRSLLLSVSIRRIMSCGSRKALPLPVWDSHQPAASAFEKAIAIRPDDIRSRLGLARALLHSKSMRMQSGRSMRSLNDILRISLPGTRKDWHCIAWKNTRNPLSTLEKACTLDPENNDALYHIAASQLATGNVSRSSRFLQQPAYRRILGIAAAWYELGTALAFPEPAGRIARCLRSCAPDKSGLSSMRFITVPGSWTVLHA